MKTMKKIVSLVLAVACMMSLAVSAFAADAETTFEVPTTEPNVIADVYVDYRINTILHIDAHLTDANVPPLTAPTTNNAWLTIEDGQKYVVVEFVNETFVVESIAENAEKGGATVVGTISIPDTVRGGEFTRIQYVKFSFTDYDESYTFTAQEYVNHSTFTDMMGQSGKTKNFDLTLKVTDPNA